MEPFPPNDPVFKVLGKARPVEPRPNFTQNVLRAIRQEPQRETLWEQLREKWVTWVSPRALWAGSGTAFAALMAVWVGVQVLHDHPANDGSSPLASHRTSTPGLIATSPEESFSAVEEPVSVATQLESMDQLSLLLAQQDTTALTDNEIALLLY